MKNGMKVLAALLCLALWMSAMPVELLPLTVYASEAEGEPESPAESVVTEAPVITAPPAATEAPAATAPPAVTEAPAEAPVEKEEPAATEVPVETEAPTAAPAATEDPNAINYAANAGESKAFALGFAAVLKDSTPVYETERADAEERAKLSRGVVYVIERTDRKPDRVAVVFNAGPEIGLDSGWVDAERVRPMEPEQEVPAYIQNCAKLNETLYYRNRAELPLARIGCAYPEKVQEADAASAPEPAVGAETMQAVEDIPLIPAANAGEPIALSVKMTCQLSFTAPEGVSYTFNTSDSKVATVSKSGLITAKGIGDATITLQAGEKEWGSWKVSVVAAPAFTLKKKTVSLGVGETFALSSLIDTAPAEAPVEYTYSVTSGGSYASLSNGDIVTAKKGVGTAKIRVTSSSGKYADVSVKVYARAEEMTLGKYEITLGEKQSETLKVSFAKVDGKAAYAQYELTSGDNDIATVAEDGTITARSKGSTTITARTLDGALSQECAVEVLAAPEEGDIFFEGLKNVTLGVGETMTAAAGLSEDTLGTITYAVTETSKSGVLSINKTTGKIAAKKTGTATVTAKLDNSEATASYEVKVVKAPTSVKLASSTLKLGENDTYALKEYNAETDEGIIKIPSGSHASYTYKTSDKKIVTVDKNGKIAAVKKGTAKIRITAQNGQYKDLTVKVYKPAETITVTPSVQVIGAKMTGSVKVGFDSSSHYNQYTLESSDKSVLVVKSDKTMTAADEVSAPTLVKITATGIQEPSLTATEEVLVLPAPKDADLSIPTLGDALRIKLGVGEQATPAAVCSEGTMADFSYKITKTSKSGVLSINKTTGKIAAKKAGTATVTATANNSSASISYEVEVVKAPTSVSLKKSTLKLGKNDTYTLKEYNAETGEGIIEISSGSHASFTYKTSDKKVVTVDKNGTITPVEKGTAKIRITAQNGRYKDLTVKVYEQADTITVTPSATEIGSGMSGKVSVSFDSTSVYTHYTLESDAPDVLAVAQDGTLTAGNVDSMTVVTITAASAAHPEITSSCEVKVYPAPTSLSFKDAAVASGVQIAVGQKRGPYEAVGEPGTIGEIVYESSKASVLTVNATTGKLQGKKAGKATVTAYLKNNREISASYEVEVKDAPSSLSLKSTTIKLGVGNEYQLRETGEGGIITITSNTFATYTYTVKSGSEYVSVTENGLIRANSAGTAVVKVETHNGLSKNLTVTVCDQPDAVFLTAKAKEIEEGSTTKVSVSFPKTSDGKETYDTYELSVDDENIASIEPDGTLTANHFGEATVTVQTTNGLSASCVVKVYKLPTAVTLTPKEAEVGIRERKLQLTAAFGGEGESGSLTFTSSNTRVATVDSDGLVTFVAPGTVKITVRTVNGKTASSTITILDQPEKIFFEQSSYSVALGDRIDIAPKYDKSWESYTLSADSEAVEIDGDCIRGVEIGSAVVTATSSGGLTASCTVEVVSAPTGLLLEPAEAQMYLDSAPLKLRATVQPHGIGSVSYESSDPKVAAVDAVTGVVTAVAEGECVITAVTYDGKHRAECAVSVINLPLYGVKIGIDPGHQKKGNSAQESSSPKNGTMKAKVSSGTTGVATKTPEYVTNLEISLKLRDALVALGAEVYMTRETHDINISNQERAALMNKKNVDLALRIHCNGSGNQSVNGLEIYTRKTCAYGSSEVNESELLANEKCAAQAIFDEVGASTGAKKNNIYYNDNYTMNNWSKVPCLLVELGYMTNPNEDRNLNNSEYQDKIVRGLINGICVYEGIDKIYP